MKPSDVAKSKAGHGDDDMTGMRKRWRSEEDSSGNEENRADYHKIHKRPSEKIETKTMED